MELSLGVGLAALGAGLSMGISAIGAGIGVGIAGAAGAGVIAE
ncbi:MAG: V-type ATP synthase subunit K, partial [Deltaproteobacteria bacterium]|nr:V-type ATP synthase subunit K [Deltaproteobacteria bacterium]